MGQCCQSMDTKHNLLVREPTDLANGFVRLNPLQEFQAEPCVIKLASIVQQQDTTVTTDIIGHSAFVDGNQITTFALQRFTTPQRIGAVNRADNLKTSLGIPSIPGLLLAAIDLIRFSTSKSVGSHLGSTWKPISPLAWKVLHCCCKSSTVVSTPASSALKC